MLFRESEVPVFSTTRASYLSRLALCCSIRIAKAGHFLGFLSLINTSLAFCQFGCLANRFFALELSSPLVRFDFGFITSQAAFALHLFVASCALLLLEWCHARKFKKPLASSRHVTWRIQVLKSWVFYLDIVSVLWNFFRMEMYGIFRIKGKVTMPRVAEYLVGMFSFEYPYCCQVLLLHPCQR